jgi:hypothetical protein
VFAIPRSMNHGCHAIGINGRQRGKVARPVAHHAKGAPYGFLAAGDAVEIAHFDEKSRLWAARQSLPGYNRAMRDSYRGPVMTLVIWAPGYHINRRKMWTRAGGYYRCFWLAGLHRNSGASLASQVHRMRPPSNRRAPELGAVSRLGEWAPLSQLISAKKELSADKPSLKSVLEFCRCLHVS